MNKKKARRKYYLTFKAKKRGFGFVKEGKTRILWVAPCEIQEAKEDKYVCLLMNEYGFGVQLKNPLITEQ